MKQEVLRVNIEAAGYGNHPVLHNLSMEIRSGEIVTILGPNGAGKSTLVRALSGLIDFKGQVSLNGERLDGLPAEIIARHGVIQVPEGRGTLGPLSVRENLMVGAYRRRDQAGVRRDLDWICTLFPKIKERLRQQAGSLSGGEQQMLAIGRGLMGAPRILILDEPSLGLAPIVIEQIFAILSAVRAERNLGMLLVEQNATMALEISDRGHVLEEGSFRISGSGAQLLSDKGLIGAYIGSNVAGN